MIKNRTICFIADGYPSEHQIVNAFVETLVNAIADMGIRCVVISPQSISKVIKNKRKILPYKRTRITPKGNIVVIFTPKYVSASTKRIGAINTAKITLNNFKRAAHRTFKELNKELVFDAVYGHFIFESGIVANYIGKKYEIPAFFAYGENTTYSIEYLGVQATSKLLDGISGVISVSSENKRVLLENGIVISEKIGVFPNSIDSTLFYKRDKIAMREKLGFQENAFIVAFVGRFLEVKGPNRLSKAIEELDDSTIHSVFIGEGPLLPDCDNILHIGTVPHEQLGEYLSACDVFVLPTLAEGCCNAIIEAMACGLPIVSSNLPFNDDILDNNNAIRVDPNNIVEISNAIIKLKKDHELRNRLSEGAIKTSEELKIDERAKKILSFMGSCTKH